MRWRSTQASIPFPDLTDRLREGFTEVAEQDFGLLPRDGARPISSRMCYGIWLPDSRSSIPPAAAGFIAESTALDSLLVIT